MLNVHIHVPVHVIRVHVTTQHNSYFEFLLYLRKYLFRYFRSLDIKVKLDIEGKKDKNGQIIYEKFRYKVKQLPDVIVPSESTYKVSAMYADNWVRMCFQIESIHAVVEESTRSICS